MNEVRPNLTVLRNQPIPRQPRITYPLWALIACAIMVVSAGGIALAAWVML